MSRAPRLNAEALSRRIRRHRAPPPRTLSKNKIYKSNICVTPESGNDGTKHRWPAEGGWGRGGHRMSDRRGEAPGHKTYAPSSLLKLSQGAENRPHPPPI
ncbi:hypothetical protein AAFF_G00273770 [Aldrovandia affinis]|uniref:Uncharacterized protein n=1 Tax=Aldrovandia affinis TaxID=143900 RepID=A0AAD7WSM2_9TELE|nr:hypothetical protein AAFF_G00273770 [Aldrovandia affinis]